VLFILDERSAETVAPSDLYIWLRAGAYVPRHGLSQSLRGKAWVFLAGDLIERRDQCRIVREDFLVRLFEISKPKRKLPFSGENHVHREVMQLPNAMF